MDVVLEALEGDERTGNAVRLADDEDVHRAGDNAVVLQECSDELGDLVRRRQQDRQFLEVIGQTHRNLCVREVTNKRGLAVRRAARHREDA